MGSGVFKSDLEHLDNYGVIILCPVCLFPHLSLSYQAGQSCTNRWAYWGFTPSYISKLIHSLWWSWAVWANACICSQMSDFILVFERTVPLMGSSSITHMRCINTFFSYICYPLRAINTYANVSGLNDRELGVTPNWNKWLLISACVNFIFGSTFRRAR